MFIENNPAFASLIVYTKKTISFLTFLVRVFFSVDLSSPSEIATTRNGVFPANGLFIFLFGLPGNAACLMLLYTVAKMP